MTPLQALFSDGEAKMRRSIDNIKREFREIRGGRASPGLVEHLSVEYYGASTPLKQLAAITAPEPRMLVIQPWDANALQEIERAVQKAGIGVSPVVDGKIVRLPIPPLSGERRDELTKLVHRLAEEGRISIRTVRRDANDMIKKLKNDKKISEDESFKAQDRIQKLTDQFIGQINQLAKSKEQELHAT